MTDLEINKAIHTFIMGECAMPTVDNDSTWERFDEDGICRECNRGIGDHTRIPKYTSDLNAVHLAEMKVVETIHPLKYIAALGEATGAGMSKIILATARQRAEAVLRATGNWVDGNDLSEDARPMVEDGPSAEDQAQHDFMMGL